VAYTNGQSVKDLATTAGVTVTLYAVWQIPANTIIVTNGANLAEKLAWLKTNAQSNTDYTIEVSADESIGPNNHLSYSDKTNIGITLIGTGMERTVSLSSNGPVFNVGSGVTLTLGDNIILQGKEDNLPLIWVSEGGTLVMETGSKITGNKNTIGGGGVVVFGTFTMNGGEISGNTASSVGGGVDIYNGTFTMVGGEISGNTASNGGGVYMTGTNATFTMHSGEISGNTATYSGGGVYVFGDGTFTMKGGEISGNTGPAGGGVYVGWGTFTMNGGKISGNTASTGGGAYVTYTSFPDETYMGTFIMNGGTISGNTANQSGGGVYVRGDFDGTFCIVNGTIYGSGETNASLRNTAPTGAALDNNGTAEHGTFSDDDWNSNGDLDTTDDTIKVVNGNLQ
jgi:hypothetical protein